MTGYLPERIQLDTRELLRIERTEEGAFLHLRDAAGQTVALHLPERAVREVGELAPAVPPPDTRHVVQSWRLQAAEVGDGLVLTLCTVEGGAVSFLLQPWQIEGIATLATHRSGAPRPTRGVN